MLYLTLVKQTFQLSASQMLAAWPNRNQFLAIAVVAFIVFLATSSRKSGRRCTNCKEINRPHANYCAQCGQALKKS